MMSGGRWRPPSELISCRRHQTRRGRQPRRRALDLGLHLPADDYILAAGADNATATPPSPRQEDGLELTLAIGSGGASRSRRRDDGTGTGTGTPLGSDCSGGSLTSTSTDTASGSPAYRRGMPAFRLQEGAAAAMKQPQPRSPWLVQCLSLKMA